MTARKIVQYDLSGNLIKVWDSFQEVVSTLNISSYDLGKACEEYGICDGYRWNYQVPTSEEVWSHCLWNNEIIWASNMGRIQNDDGMPIYGSKSEKRHYRTRYRDKKVLVHVLICLAFKGRPGIGERFDVKHIDGNRANNRAENLKWIPRSELINESIRFPRPVNQYDKSGLFLRSFSSTAEASRITGIMRIGRACSGHVKSTGGYIWKYGDRFE